MSLNRPLPVSVYPQRPVLLRMLSSVWLGVILLALIVLYSSVVSALPPVLWALELTEMAAFRHWLFVSLVALLAVSLLCVTFLRMRWKGVNAGSLLAHIGLLMLIGGAVAYFGTKVEGDVLLQSPTILVRATLDGNEHFVGRFRAAEGESWSRSLPHLDQPLSIVVLKTVAAGVQPVAAVEVGVRVGDGQPRIITLDNQPDHWQPIDDIIAVSLATYPTRTAFYEDETPVLYVRDLAAGSETMHVIENLPIHRERYLPGEGVLRDARGNEIPSRRTRPEIRLGGLAIPTGWFESWRMPIDVDSDGLPFAIRVTGYVPFCLGLRREDAGTEGIQAGEPILEVPENRRVGLSPRVMSAIRLELTGRGKFAGWSETRWCEFSSYPDVDARPIRILLPGDDTVWQVTYSRARHGLGAELAARRLSVTYFPGRRGIESYRSDLRVRHGAGPPREATVSTNSTLALGRWTLFQSGFDFDEHWRYTILGVGNRIGIWPMNLGWIVITLGCLYAFYVKPMLLRRAREGGQ